MSTGTVSFMLPRAPVEPMPDWMHLPEISPDAPPKTQQDLIEEKAAAERQIQQGRFCQYCGSCLIKEQRNDQSPPPQRKRINENQQPPPQRKRTIKDQMREEEEESRKKKKKNSEIRIDPASVLA